MDGLDFHRVKLALPNLPFPTVFLRFITWETGKLSHHSQTRHVLKLNAWPLLQRIDERAGEVAPNRCFFGLELKLKTIYTVHRLDATRFLLMLT